jgi:DNA repair exonuclease SbcCD ATPase subunit
MIARGDIDGLSAEIGKLTSNLELTSRKLVDAQAASDKAKANLDQVQATLTFKEAEIGKLSSTIDEMKTKIAEKDRELKNLAAASAMAIAESEKQKKHSRESGAKVDEVMRKLAAVNVELENAKGEVKRLAATVSLRENEVAMLRGAPREVMREPLREERGAPREVTWEPLREEPRDMSREEREAIREVSKEVPPLIGSTMDQMDLPQITRGERRHVDTRKSINSTSSNIFGPLPRRDNPISENHSFENLVADKERELLDANLVRSSLRSELGRLGEGLPKLMADRTRQAEILNDLLPRVERKLGELRLWFKQNKL